MHPACYYPRPRWENMLSPTSFHRLRQTRRGLPGQTAAKHRSRHAGRVCFSLQKSPPGCDGGAEGGRLGFSRAAASRLKLRLPVCGRETDHHLRVHAVQRAGVVPLAGGNGDRVAGMEQEFFISQAVFEPA